MVTKIKSDVLVIGGGAAGSRAALEAKKLVDDVLIVDKCKYGFSGSSFRNFTGNLGYVLPRKGRGEPADDNELKEEIMDAGEGMCDVSLVDILVGEARQRFSDLTRMGIGFEKRGGELRRVKGCFSRYPFAVILKDINNFSTVMRKSVKESGIRVISNLNVLRLLVSDGGCIGAAGITEDDEICLLLSGATVLTTGGGGGIFRYNMLPGELVGDGYVMAFQRGAELDNMEFIQIMMGEVKAEGLCFFPLKEITRRDMIKDIDGTSILDKYIPKEINLENLVRLRSSHHPFSVRDDSGLIDIAIMKGIRKNLYQRMPYIEFYKDGHKGRVSLFAHAFNGGLRINQRAESTLPGLFAAGEVAGGMHGADRLGGAMMTATQVFGARAGHFAGKRARSSGRIPEAGRDITGEIDYVKRDIRINKPVRDEIMLGIRNCIWESLILIRNKNDLEVGLKRINRIDKDIHTLEKVGRSTKPKHENRYRLSVLKGMATLAILLLKSSLKREESRGSHYREDYPEKNEMRFGRVNVRN